MTSARVSAESVCMNMTAALKSNRSVYRSMDDETLTQECDLHQPYGLAAT